MRIEGGSNGVLNLGRVDVSQKAFGLAMPKGLVADAEGLDLQGRLVVRKFEPITGVPFSSGL